MGLDLRSSINFCQKLITNLSKMSEERLMRQADVDRMITEAEERGRASMKRKIQGLNSIEF